MARYMNKDPQHLDPPHLRSRGVRMPTEREIRLTNRRMSYVWGGEASKVKESGKGDEQVKYNMVSEGYWKRPMLLWDI